MPVRRQFANPSQNLFREIAILEQWLLDNEERGRCPPNSSLRITGSRSTVPILAAVAPRFTLTKETFVVFACIPQTSVRWNLTLWGGLAPFTRSSAISKWQYYRFEKPPNFWNYMQSVDYFRKKNYALLSCLFWKWEKECNNQFTISCGERKIIAVIHAELTHIRAHGDQQVPFWSSVNNKNWGRRDGTE